jgi:hypothetical protein
MVIASTVGATDEGKGRAAEERIFAAIMSRDARALEGKLAADFILSSAGKPDQARDDFLRAIASTPCFSHRVLRLWRLPVIHRTVPFVGPSVLARERDPGSAARPERYLARHGAKPQVS